MALSDRLTGLKNHEINVPPPMPEPVEVATFDQAKAGRLMADAISIIEGYYPAGALEWLRLNRSDIYFHLKQREQAVDAAYLAGNSQDLTAALEKYVEAHERAFKVFEARESLSMGNSN